MKGLVGLIILYQLSLCVVPLHGVTCDQYCSQQHPNDFGGQFSCVTDCINQGSGSGSGSVSTTTTKPIDWSSKETIITLSIIAVVVVAVVVGIVLFKFWIVKKRRRAQAPIMPVGGGGVIGPQPYAPDPYSGVSPYGAANPSATGTAVVYE